ncbi:transglycosylase SLT domain-containing protein [Spongiibacter sp. KMU-158]|uniref:Transglycosylase SLT domain-containing protein n=1 Tax=Spongiibacter pelagi TaxID=2760804 RepID=A0A927C285_9GAMM|nr:transglycosylase SLT domain-containing protein [Spongiibacter pelagi]MBD2858522.1 transglycosylase SLT domain-containing protein [Spongiibacter pelagi]
MSIHQGRFRKGLFVLLPLLCFTQFGLSQSVSDTSSPDQSTLQKQREVYREALLDISQGRLEKAEAVGPQLYDYLLYPYFELELIKAQIDTVSSQTIKSFLQQYDGSLVAENLRASWIYKLKKHQQWPEFLAYVGDKPPANLECEYIAAIRSQGDEQNALLRSEKLWHTGVPLDTFCTNVVDQWLQTLTPEQQQRAYWRRADMAVDKGYDKLASFLLSKISGTELQQRLLNHPEALYKESAKIKNNAFNHQLVVFTLKRLARGDYLAASELWQSLQLQFNFSSAENYSLRNAFARQMIADNGRLARQWLAEHDDEFEDAYLTEWRVRLALKDRDWKKAQHYIASLPADYRQKSDWQYWWARADRAIHRKLTEPAKTILQKLADERGYYSFLAADLLGQPYQLGHIPALPSELNEPFQANLGLQRAREFYILGDYGKASSEWRRAIQFFSKPDRLAAAKLALDWGWANPAVVGAIQAGAWNDLGLRFPLAYQDDFVSNAKANEIDLKWAFSIARQESAFAENARSPVGARGIMQLMPGTARDTAKAMGAPKPSSQDLENPQINIAIGTYYLGSLLREFNGNRILATAAYNAGPNRIKRVLEKQEAILPADIWIENLPYSETRHYIKNVLAFSVIYGEKLELNQPLLSKNERLIRPSQELAQNQF